MGDNKLCSSCGNVIPAEAVFCPNCGSVQAAPEKTAEAAKAEDKMPAAVEDQGENYIPANPEVGEPIIEPESGQAPMPEAAGQEPAQQPMAETTAQEPAQPPRAEATAREPAQQTPVAPAPSAQTVNPQPAAPKTQGPQPVYQQTYPQQQTYAQAPQQYQQPAQGQYYQQPPYVQPQTPPKPQKEFPWGFTITWVVMLVFVAVWAFLWTTYPESQRPVITMDTWRVVSVAVSAVLLIYTLNLRLATKKLKALPAILLILCLLISVFMFCAVELIEGDFAHDVISPITDNIFPVQ